VLEPLLPFVPPRVAARPAGSLSREPAPLLDPVPLLPLLIVLLPLPAIPPPAVPLLCARAEPETTIAASKVTIEDFRMISASLGIAGKNTGARRQGFNIGTTQKILNRTSTETLVGGNKWGYRKSKISQHTVLKRKYQITNCVQKLAAPRKNHKKNINKLKN
jgi:hypothetical protein